MVITKENIYEVSLCVALYSKSNSLSGEIPVILTFLVINHALLFDNPSHCMLDTPSPHAILLLTHTPRCSAYISTLKEIILVAVLLLCMLNTSQSKKPVVPSVVLQLDDVLTLLVA